MKIHRSVPGICLFILILLLSCRQGDQNESVDLSAFGRYISGHVPEVIRSTDPVRIRFAQPAVHDSLVGTQVDKKFYTVNPRTDGSATWDDASTFRFMPSSPFVPGGSYDLTIGIDKLFPDVEAGLETARFRFSIRPLTLSLSLETPMLSESDPTMESISGLIRTSEAMTPKDVITTVSIQYSGTTVTPQWTHSDDGFVHGFDVQVPRGQSDQVLRFELDGRQAGSPSQRSADVLIPGLGTFKVTDVSIADDGTREIRIVFSDFLHPGSDLTGLVLLNGSEAGFSIRQSKHVISLFPQNDISGEINVYVDRTIRNRDGKLLEGGQTHSVSFADVPPQVELIGKGNVVPNSGEVILPFRAVNLTTVDVEIFEVFESNVLQFLQYGDLWYAGGYEATGRVVGSHVVGLNTQQPDIRPNQWVRYAIDLSHYTDMRPGSIYEVRIGFRQSYTLNSCGDVTANDRDAEGGSIWQYFYDYDDYRYENRDNPCKREYYSADRFVRRNVLASNLGLAAKAGADNKFQVYVHDLRTTEVISGCSVRLFDFQQQLLVEGRTDAEGRCTFESDRSPAFIIADYRGEKGYLKVTDGAALSLSDFDVSGTTAKEGMRGFIYGDRDIWRPGDTLFLDFILQSQQAGTTDHPVTCTVYNPRGQTAWQATTQYHVGSIYHFPVPTMQSDLTGNWRAEIQVGAAKFNKTLKVETIKPNRLKILIDTDGPVKAWVSQQKIPLDVSWLHGAPANGLNARVELALSPSAVRFQGYQDFRFDDPTRAMNAAVTTLFDGKLDEQGTAQILLPTEPDEEYPGKMTAHLKTRVFEQGGDFSTDQFTTEWWPYARYAGLSIPRNRWGYQQLEQGADNTISIASVDHTGKGLAKTQLTVGVYHADWHWWWNQDSYEMAQFNSAQHLGAFVTDTVITDQKGHASFVFKPSGYGLYLIRVCDTGSGHCSGDFAYSGYFYGEEDGRSAAARLTLSTDKVKYAPGDEVRLNIPSAPGSRVLITLENETSILSTHALEAQGDLTKFSFKVTATMAPNIYAHVQLIQPHNGGENDLPIRMYGVVPVLVEDPATRLEPVITMPDALRPEQSFQIRVREAHAHPMAYTIAVVDEGLLDLTRFKTPDPWDHFYAKRALGVKSWDLYDNVLGGLGGSIERILAIGGDGTNVQIQAVNEVNRFKPVVRHLGPFYLKAGTEATHTITMPNYVGSVRAMVVASAGTQYGSAEKTVKVKNPLMLLTSMPRVLSPGEEIAIPVNIFAMEDDVRDVEVSIRGDRQLSITGPAQKTLTFNRQGDQMIVFNGEVAQTVGSAIIEIEARSGRETAHERIEIVVRNPNPVTTEVAEYTVEAGATWRGNVELVGMPGTNENVIEVSTLFPANLSERLGYLIRYPYGCLEQTTSAAFPQLFVDQLIELTPEKRNAVSFHIRAAIDKVSGFTNPSGGFSYWPGISEVHEWTNSYTGHFLLEAQRAGYYIPPDLLEHWKTFQSSRARQFSLTNRSSSALLNQAYRLYTLAMSGSPEIGAMNRLRNVKALPPAAASLLGAAYSVSGQSAIGSALIAADPADGDYPLAGETFGSPIRDRALIVEAMLASGKADEALPVVRRIGQEIGSKQWFSTQSTAFALLALSKYAGIYNGEELHFAMSSEAGPGEIVRQSKQLYSKTLRDNDESNISVENKMSGPIYVRVIRTGQSLNPVTKTSQSHLSLRVSYEDMQGNVLNPSSLKQGTDFIMTINVRNPGTLSGNLDAVALQTLFPAGWELLNGRLDRLNERFRNSAFEYQDIRDDRVFTFFDLPVNKTKTFHFALNAAYIGRYVLPAIQCEGMYDRAIQATHAGGWVEVREAGTRVGKASVSGG